MRAHAAAVSILLALVGVSRAEVESRSGYVDSDGARLHYLEAVPPKPASSGTSLLFIPGWMMPAEMWEQQLRHFGRSRRVVAMDPRGQGRSSTPPDGHHPAGRAKDIQAVVRKLGLAPVVLVATGMSVSDAGAFVDQFGTGELAGIVLVQGVPGADHTPEAAVRLFRWAAGMQTDRRARTEQMVKSLFKDPPDGSTLARWVQGYLRAPTHAAIAAFVGAFAADYRPALTKVDRPTLIVAMRNEWAAQFEALQRSIPRSKLVLVDGVAHGMFLEHPERFNPIVEEFLGSLSLD